MSNPLITVGITSFNADKTLEWAISSALSQSWSSLEVIVVDDCSVDESLILLKKLAQQHPKLKVFCNSENSGVAFSRNRILEEAKGEFVVFFDDDDESLPYRICAQYKRITDYELQFANGAPVICHTARKLIYPHGKIRIEKTMGQIEEKPAPFGPAVARRILLGEPLEDGYGACPTCSQMARLSTYKLLGGFDPSFRRGEDTDFNIRLAQAGGHFVGISEPLVIQTMTKTAEKSLRDEYYFAKRLLQKHREFIKKQSLFNFSMAWLDLKQAWLENHQLIFMKLLLRLCFIHPFLAMRRLIFSLPNIGLNRAFSHFHNNTNNSSTS